MGTMRWEKESAERVASEVADVAGKLKLVTLDAQQAELEVRMKAVQTELVAKQVEGLVNEQKWVYTPAVVTAASGSTSTPKG